MTAKPVLNRAQFHTSVAQLRDLPYSRAEIAFAGRSNAGKSSAINLLTRKNRLAFTSKTPGRTQLINFFELDADTYLVDLPGYGYAKVPPAVKAKWEDLLSRYLQEREALVGMVLIMDARHPLTPLDRQMLDWFTPTGKPVHILLSKADKLSNSEKTLTLRSGPAGTRGIGQRQRATVFELVPAGCRGCGGLDRGLAQSRSINGSRRSQD